MTLQRKLSFFKITHIWIILPVVVRPEEEKVEEKTVEKVAEKPKKAEKKKPGPKPKAKAKTPAKKEPPKKRGRPPKKKPVEPEPDDMDESEEEEEEEEGLFGDKDVDDDESSDEELDMETFDTSRLVKDEADRKYLEKLPEFEREAILGERFEKLKADQDMKKALRESK